VVTPFLVLGSINFDTVCKVGRLPRRHEKVRSESVRDSLGGSAANTASWLARLGAQVSVFGTVGSDSYGVKCNEWLTEAGVDASPVFVDGHASTGRAICMSTSQDKRIITSGGPPVSSALAAFRIRLASAPKGIVHIAAPETDILVDACAAAVASGWLLSVELNGRRMDRIRELATIAFLNHDELKRAFNLGWKDLNPDQLTSILPTPQATLAVTLGRSGALSLRGEGITQARAKMVSVVERTGAGDAFDAGYLAAYALARDTAECLEQGLQTAARVLGYIGGHP
jgi:sugar/nucleoside kinase (ribokinase family)